MADPTACACEGPLAYVADPTSECDESPRVCARHGTDPCHDDAWHYRMTVTTQEDSDG
jgi:hypothetical protein